ncbi:PREDICTED: fatty acid-binding protein, brain-like [Branchiostoma belcheri]|uniref:Fatty acid binding protein n=1 Tax=Branchiostoma belcheri TaxID=7741 RepID=D3VW14_BRABE|nr:PREDICTED: fatty acid-binding protein, brain-like [Branchiostoma belcheri]ADD10136.1 fatty acid binding protein [Branchiostoma belcheri]
MPVDLSGTWKLDSSENFEEFMKKLEVNMALRKMGALAKPTTEITQTGDHFVIKTSTTFKNTAVEFDIGQEFDEKTADDKEVKSVATWDGDKLVVTQKRGPPIGDVLYIRELQGDDALLLTCTAGDVVCKRHYKKGK